MNDGKKDKNHIRKKRKDEGKIEEHEEKKRTIEGDKRREGKSF